MVVDCPARAVKIGAAGTDATPGDNTTTDGDVLVAAGGLGLWWYLPCNSADCGTQRYLGHPSYSVPALRERLCKAGLCNADGVPVQRPEPESFAD